MKNNFNLYPSLFDLKKYSNLENKKETKSMLSHFETEKQDFSVGAIINHLTKKRGYETYLYICDENSIASMLFYKTFQKKMLSKIYYYYLCYLVKRKNIFQLSHILEKRHKI